MEIENQLQNLTNLKWYPFIGQQYFDLDKNNRIMIVGESHYFKPSENNSFEKHENKFFTQTIIKELAIDRNYYNTKVYRNFHYALMGNDSFDSNELWSKLAFYNFIQRQLNFEKSERPNKNDIVLGWSVFLQLIEILQPSVVIFIGTSATNYLSNSYLPENIRIDRIISEPKINNTYPRKTKLFTDNQDTIEMLFLKHTSKFFSWRKWHKFLLNEISDKMEQLSQ